MIQDTTFLVDLMQGDDDAIEREVELASSSRPQSIASITLAELSFGVERSSRPGKEKRRIRSVLEPRLLYSADADVMRSTGRIRGRLANRGEPIDVSDAIVAATALTVGEPVLTRNVAHFHRVDGVEVETY